MKITMKNISQNWKVLIILIISIKFLTFLLFKILEIEKIFGMEFYLASTFISVPVFFLYLHFKNENPA